MTVPITPAGGLAGIAGPLAAISFGLSIASSWQESKNAKKVAKYQAKLAARNREIAAAQADRSIGQIRRRQVQERALLSQQTLDVSDRARAAVAAATTQAADSGTSGASFAALIDDFERQELNVEQNLLRAQKFRDQQADAQSAQIRTGQEVSNLNSLPDPVTLPSWLGTLGGAANDALNTYIGAGGGR